MMMPTARAAFLFAGGLPIALILVTAAPDLWSVSLDYSVLVLVAVAADALIAFPPRRLALVASTGVYSHVLLLSSPSHSSSLESCRRHHSLGWDPRG